MGEMMILWDVVVCGVPSSSFAGLHRRAGVGTAAARRRHAAIEVVTSLNSCDDTAYVSDVSGLRKLSIPANLLVATALRSTVSCETRPAPRLNEGRKILVALEAGGDVYRFQPFTTVECSRRNSLQIVCQQL
jgi:hypothetical protein